MSTATEVEMPAVRLNVDGIPAELRDDQCVLWRIEYRADKKTGELKPTKEPYQTNGRLAESDDRRTWNTFDVVCEQYAAGGYSGIGRVFAADDPYTGIDIDDCRDPETGTITGWGQELIDDLASYTEISPSATGVKTWCRATLKHLLEGKKAKTGRKTKYQGGEVELYDKCKYFAMTGNHLEGTPTTINEAQAAVDRTWRKLDEAQKRKAGKHKTNGKHTAEPATDEPSEIGELFAGCPAAQMPTSPQAKQRTIPEILAAAQQKTDQEVRTKASSFKNGAKFNALWSGDTSAYGNDDSSADAALCSLLAFVLGPDRPRIDSLFRQSGLFREEKWGAREDYRDSTLSLVLDGRTVEDYYDWTAKPKSKKTKSKSTAATTDPTLPVVVVSDREHETNDDAARALADKAESLGVYERGCRLVRVMREAKPPKGIERPAEAPVIGQIPDATLSETLTRAAAWRKLDRHGDLVPTHPSDRSVKAIAARGTWPGVPKLTGIVEAPTLLSCGRVLQTPGYDRDSGLLYEPNATFPSVPESPSRDEATAAAELLQEVFCDFPFRAEIHRAACIAGILTIFARHAIDGPCPLTAIDANVKGTGKSKMTDAISKITTGREFPRTAMPGSEEEWRKRITSIAMAGEPLMLLDNVSETLESASLDAVLTATRWSDRLLGGMQMTGAMPISTVWFATGNNLQFGGDVARRTCHIRLESKHEQPEDRSDFRHANLLDWVRSQRPQLAVAALTVLRGYVAAGRPDQRLPAWGSFEAWSGLVRAALVWAGMPDPAETRIELRRDGDRDRSLLAMLIAGILEVDPQRVGITALSMIERVTNAKANELQSLRAAVTAMQTGALPNARSMGMRIGKLRGRILEGQSISCKEGNKGQFWLVEDVRRERD